MIDQLLASSKRKLNVQVGKWNVLPAVHGPSAYGGNSFVVGDSVYVYGGYYAGYAINSFVAYDLAANGAISVLPNPPFYKSYGASCVYDNHAYWYGGWENPNLGVGVTTMWKMNISTMEFTQLPNGPRTCIEGSSVVVESSWFMCNGNGTELMKYDFTTESWVTFVTGLTTYKQHQMYFASDTRTIYIVDGSRTSAIQLDTKEIRTSTAAQTGMYAGVLYLENGELVYSGGISDVDGRGYFSGNDFVMDKHSLQWQAVQAEGVYAPARAYSHWVTDDNWVFGINGYQAPAGANYKRLR